VRNRITLLLFAWIFHFQFSCNKEKKTIAILTIPPNEIIYFSYTKGLIDVFQFKAGSYLYYDATDTIRKLKLQGYKIDTTYSDSIFGYSLLPFCNDIEGGITRFITKYPNGLYRKVEIDCAELNSDYYQNCQ
jgi:hypothetical protein